MPLIHSKRPSAFSKNVSTEMHAGKPQKQALAIAYSVKRDAEHKHAMGGKVCMACGGMPCKMDEGGVIDPDKGQEVSDSFKSMGHSYSKGGDVLDTNAREHIAAKNFAGPHKSYPIEDKIHARNALARVSQFGSPHEKEEVREKVHAKYPSIDEKAEGGEVHDTDGDGELHEMAHQELMEAIHDKDPKRMKDALSAIIHTCLSRRDEE